MTHADKKFMTTTLKKKKKSPPACPGKNWCIPRPYYLHWVPGLLWVSSGSPLGRTCPVGTLYPGVDIMNDWTPHPIKSPSTHQGKLISPVCMHDVIFSPLKELTVKALTPKIGPRLIDLCCFSATMLHLVEDGCITLGQKTLLALGIN